MHAKIKKHKENLEINVFDSDDSRSSYNNKITRDPNIFAQILIDLMILGFPVEKAIKKFRERVKKRDWMGV